MLLVKPVIDTEMKEQLMGKILMAMTGTTWPDEHDLVGAIHGLLRAQSTYYLNTLDVAR